MGLAKVILGHSRTLCVTPDYMAPEMLSKKGHDLSVDWWTWGILVFELLVGFPPFQAASPMLIYKKVQFGMQKVKFPMALRGAPEQLIRKCCRLTPHERLPLTKRGIDNIKSHVWYKGFGWQDLFAQTMNPPYHPVVEDAKDTSNFAPSTD